MISTRFPLALFTVLTIFGMSLYALRYFGVEMVLYLNILIVILCVPGYMIGLTMSIALSVRTADGRDNNKTVRTFSIEKILHTTGLIVVSLFLVKTYLE